MKKKFKLSKQRKQQLYIWGLFNVLGVIFYIAYGVRTWQDPTSPIFTKYIYIPFFTFYIFYHAFTSFYNRLHERIIISDEYIEYHSFGRYSKLRWNELHAIENNSLFFWNFELITAYNRNEKKNFINETRYIKRVIPISWFDTEWRNKSLGKNIKQYAPKLFEIDT